MPTIFLLTTIAITRFICGYLPVDDKCYHVKDFVNHSHSDSLVVNIVASA